MGVNIKLTENYRLLSTPNNWIIAEANDDRIRNISFHSTAESAINSFFQMKVRGCNAKSLFGLIQYEKQLSAKLCKSLHIPVIKLDKSGLEILHTKKEEE